MTVGRQRRNAPKSKKVLLLGGSLPLNGMLIAEYGTRGYTIMACQRAVLDQHACMAEYVFLYDAQSWDVLKLYEHRHSWIYEQATLICKLGYLQCNLQHLYRIDDFRVEIWNQTEDHPTVRGCGSYALSYAFRVMEAETIVLHGFDCRSHPTYHNQLAHFPKVAERAPRGCEIYETPGSTLQLFPIHDVSGEDYV